MQRSLRCTRQLATDTRPVAASSHPLLYAERRGVVPADRIHQHGPQHAWTMSDPAVLCLSVSGPREAEDYVVVHEARECWVSWPPQSRMLDRATDDSPPKCTAH